jgi:hypothetical protein
MIIIGKAVFIALGLLLNVSAAGFLSKQPIYAGLLTKAWWQN